LFSEKNHIHHIMEGKKMSNSLKFKKITALFIVFFMVFTITACSSGGSPTTTTSSTGKPSAASKIVIARPADSRNLDPVTQSDNTDIWVINLMMEGLVKGSDDGTKIEPNLATKWEISPDGLTYTFHLVEGLKFSDGTPVTGADWIFSLTRARDEKSSIWADNLKAISNIQAPDDKTVVITLSHPFVPLLAALAMFNTTVVPKAYFEKVGASGFSQKPIGTGPFMMDQWVKGEYLNLKKNPNYRVSGLPKTDEISFTVVPDDNTRMLQLQSGAIAVSTFVPYNKMKELSNNPDYIVKNFQAAQVNYLTLNSAKKPLNDTRVRQALNYAIDKQGLINAVLNGYGTLGTSFVPSGVMFYDNNLTPYNQDLKKAKDLLAQAGYPNGGIKLELLIRSGDAVTNQIGVILKDAFSKIGVDLTIKQMEDATVTSLLSSFNFDMTLYPWSSDMVDPSEVVDRVIVARSFTSNDAPGWKDNTAIQLAADAKTEQDPAKRQKIYTQLQEIHAKESPMITLFNSGYPVIMNKNVTGFLQTPLGNYRFDNLMMNSK
jgi:peptide/nickel transport system substrate-binding protein